MSERDRVRLPQYAPHRLINAHVIYLPASRLRQWADQGHVRSLKLGDSQQSARLFNVQDVQDAVERIAQGYEPRKRRR